VTTVDAEPAPPVEAAPRDATLATVEIAPERTGTGPRRPFRIRTGRFWDLGAVLGVIAIALYLTNRLWRDIDAVRGTNGPDEAFFEWMLAHGARVVTHFDYPFVTYRMNVPDGVNLMANTSILGLSIPLSPITLLFGADASYTVLLVGAYVATGLAWYYVLSRHFVRSRPAALLGGLFCAFAPGMVAHGNGHPNIVAQFLVPFIIYRTLKLREQRRVVRNGVVLGLLVTWQAFINEEVLLMTAAGTGIFVLIAGLSVARWRRRVWYFLGGLGIAVGLSGVLLAYPLWVQFTGPGAYHGLAPGIQEYGANLASYPAFSRQSLFGSVDGVKELTQNASEENAFLGWPLLVLAGVLILALSRRIVAVAVTIVGLLFATASLGPIIKWHTEELGDGPWSWAQQVSVFDTVVPTRFALATAPVIGILLALGWDGWRRWTLKRPKWVYGRRLRHVSYVVWPALVVAALLPIVPRPLHDQPRTPAPPLVLNGRLDQYLAGGRSVMFVPPVRSVYPDPLDWAAESGLSFSMAQGYFLGPASNNPDETDKQYAIFTAPERPTTKMFDYVIRRDRVPRITPLAREQAVEDLRYWRVGVLVMAWGDYETKVWQLVTDLFKVYPQWIDGAWVWDVRPLTS
jgi:hypothetical protein